MNFTATPRGSSSPSNTLDLLGHRADIPDAEKTPGKYRLHELSYPKQISYARITVW